MSEVQEKRAKSWLLCEWYCSHMVWHCSGELVSRFVGRSNFAVAVELKEQSEMTVSLLYHMAVQRQCKNPLENNSVVGVTNYIDLGLQVFSLPCPPVSADTDTDKCQRQITQSLFLLKTVYDTDMMQDG